MKVLDPFSIWRLGGGRNKSTEAAHCLKKKSDLQYFCGKVKCKADLVLCNILNNDSSERMYQLYNPEQIKEARFRLAFFSPNCIYNTHGKFLLVTVLGNNTRK